MLSLALRGLASRKLRAALTALAIMLGVAMVAGTFMLKGSVDKAFDDIFAEANAGVDVTVQPKSAFDTGFDLPESGAALPQSLVQKVAAVDGVEKASGGISDSTSIAILDENGDRIGPPAAARPRSRRASTPSRSTRSPGSRARPRRPTTRSGSTRSPPTRRATRSARRSRSAGVRGAKEYTLAGIGRFGSGVPLGGASFAALHAPGGAGDHRQGGRARQDRRRGRPTGSRRTSCRARLNADPARRRRGEDGRRGCRPAVRRHQGRLRLPDHVPARLRRDLGLRRRLPDLQHVLDHRRPADPRVRHAADAGSVVAAGPRDRLHRGDGARDTRLDPGDRGRPRIRRARHHPVQGDGLRASAVGDRDHPGLGDRADDRRHRRDPRLVDRAGASSHPGHPARGPPRGRRDPGAPEPAPDLDRPRAGPDRDRRPRRRPVRDLVVRLRPAAAGPRTDPALRRRRDAGRHA